jgi:hypothetical protein
MPSHAVGQTPGNGPPCRRPTRLRRIRLATYGHAAAIPARSIAVLAAVLLTACSASTLPSSPAKLPTTSPPSGGPVPAQLLGNWYLPPASVTAVSGIPCPANPTPTNCFFQLELAATSWSISFVATCGIAVPSQGDVVVNNNEMDFFNSVYCGLQLPDGLGRFTWRGTAGILHFTLISDNCTRAHVLTNSGWSRTLVAGQPGG